MEYVISSIMSVYSLIFPAWNSRFFLQIDKKAVFAKKMNASVNFL